MSCSHHHCHGSKKNKVGILLSMFGTTVAEARVGYDVFETLVHNNFPNIPEFRAYTADKIRRKFKRHGEQAFTVAQALTEMYDAGFTHVAVQSLHTVPGVEYEWTKQQSKALEHPRKGLQKVTVGLPLITERFIHEVVKGIPDYIEKHLQATLPDDEAVILIGHGTYHDAQIYYQALQGLIKDFSPNYFVGTLMGDGLTAGDIIPKLEAKHIKKVHLIPFMCVPGHHFVLDISGDLPSSWASIMKEHGFACAYYSASSITHEAFATVWLENLHVALLQLGDDIETAIPSLSETASYKAMPKSCDHGHRHHHHHHEHDDNHDCHHAHHYEHVGE